MGAYSELTREGTLGRDGAELLYRTTWAVVRARHYPDPSGRGFWLRDEIQELAHDIIVHKHGGAPFAAYLIAHCNDDLSIARVMQAMVRHELADRARRTEKGRLMLRLREVLRADRFAKVAGGRERYTVVDRSSSANESHLSSFETQERMRQAAHLVTNVKLIRWNPEASRRSPIAEKESIERVLQAALSSVEFPIELAELADVVADRFGIIPTPHVMSWDSEDALEAVDASAVEVGTYRPEALLIWSQLEPEERLILPLLGESVRVAAEALGWRRTKTHSVMQRTAALLAKALDIENLEAISSTSSLSESAQVFNSLIELSVSKTKNGSNLGGD
ncbi:hypothetical protein ACFV1S_01565 [Streptomyces globisporus]|uniref:hypothetical protein n=1 Tax=Streptomyces TaxID=1883 RepID=UPI001161263D|nr:hypothetical protein [Streptomyces sp. TSRI0445]